MRVYGGAGYLGRGVEWKQSKERKGKDRNGMEWSTVEKERRGEQRGEKRRREEKRRVGAEYYILSFSNSIVFSLFSSLLFSPLLSSLLPSGYVMIPPVIYMSPF